MTSGTVPHMKVFDSAHNSAGRSQHNPKPDSSHQRRSPIIFALEVSIFLIIGLLLSSCIHYIDDSGAEHIWGAGHLVLKVATPDKEKQAIIQRSTITGIAFGLNNESFGLSVGWDQRERILIYDENTLISIQRHPSDDFLRFDIGTDPPDLDRSFAPNHSEVKERHP